MADVYKCLGQVNPAASTDTNLYTVPASTGAIVSSLVICNRDAVERYANVRVSHGAGTSSLVEFIAVYERIPPNGYKVITAGLAFTAADQINVSTDSANMNFSAYGVEQSPIPAASPKLLGQSNPVAVTLTDLYTVPVGKSAVLSSLVICNGQATSVPALLPGLNAPGGQYRLAVSVGGGAIANKDYIAYDAPVPPSTAGGANESSMTILTLGLTLAAGDKFRVYGAANVGGPNTNLAFNLFGVEL